jgi:peptidoglycan-associated lipoprotein
MRKTMRRKELIAVVVTLVAALTVAACGPKKPTLKPQPAPAATETTSTPGATTATTTPQRVDDPLPVPPQPLGEDSIASKPIDDLNRESPLKPVFFALDSADLDAAGRAVTTANADVLKRFSTWVVTVEGHCDERGTPEYNLALGERRAAAVKAYLTSLGIPAARIRTVSYGKEFPFNPGHTEEAWALNRRGHLVITSQ